MGPCAGTALVPRAKQPCTSAQGGSAQLPGVLLVPWVEPDTTRAGEARETMRAGEAREVNEVDLMAGPGIIGVVDFGVHLLGFGSLAVWTSLMGV